MDRRERIDDPQTALLTALAGWQADLWTALPAIVQSFNPDAMTCEAIPTIQAQVTNPETSVKEWVNIPLLVDCPVIFPSGGNCTLTFPIKPGDECLVIFASRCIDAWWQSGKVDIQTALRMHDLSDGFILAGVRSQPRVLSNVNTAAAELRSDDGAAVVRLNPTTHEVDVVTTGNVLVSAGGTAKLTATHVIVHASESYAKDVGGYGEKITNDGAGNITVDTYYIGATVTTQAHNYNPPEIP